MELGLLYRALINRQVDMIAANSTDGQIQALGLAKENDASELKNWLTISNAESADKKISAVTSVYNRLGVKAICEEKMQFFYSKSISNLDKVSVSENKKKKLRNLAAKLMLRQE